MRRYRYRHRHLVGLLVLAVVLVGLASRGGGLIQQDPLQRGSHEKVFSSGTLSTTPPAPATTALPKHPGMLRYSASCHVTVQGEYVLPDPRCTPGATNPAVTQANIGQTICKSGWTATVRPPESYTEPLKRHQMVAYGFGSWLTPPSEYELDHLVPLELGGSPSDPKNLWPEPGASPNSKDKVEAAAHRAVCSGRMPLATAQHAIATNWITLGKQLGVA